MDLSLQALVMGLVQGLTEFLPVSSSGHLILVPWLFGWKDPFITSLEFSVTLHMGTLLALLVFFWRDWVKLIPAGLASIRDRSLRGDPDPVAKPTIEAFSSSDDDWPPRPPKSASKCPRFRGPIAPSRPLPSIPEIRTDARPPSSAADSSLPVRRGHSRIPPILPFSAPAAETGRPSFGPGRIGEIV